MTKDQLTMTFDPNTIEHLGVRLYSTLPPVLSELIANAYDANADWVKIKLMDYDGKKKIIVEDNGIGMTFKDIDDKFLHIGRNRREDDEDKPTDKGRKVIGKKGLGKLSFFGIAHQIEITTKKDGKENIFVMNWGDIKKKKKDYHPTIIKKDEECSKKEHGTMVTLTDMQRESDFSSKQLAGSLSKIFIVDAGFEIIIQHNEEEPITIDNELKFAELDKEVVWNIPDDSDYKSDYERKDEITGYLLATKKPISPRTNMRGIVLFSRKKLVNLPEYFSDSTSSHFFSYLTGWLEVNFIDDLKDDVIATNRQSLNWDHPEVIKLKVYLQGLLGWLQTDWRKKRAKIREGELEKKTGMKIGEWRETIPENINKDLDPIVSALLKESEMSEEQTVGSLKGLQNIIKPYPYFHWRNLHATLQNIVFNYYKTEDYYTGVFEGAKKYINELKKKSGEKITDRDLIENVFSLKKPKLSVTDKYHKPDGNSFEAKTITNITEGHRMLAIAMWQAFRSPIAHEEVVDLRDSGLFTEKDCLDALSLLSHLFCRLDNSVKATP